MRYDEAKAEADKLTSLGYNAYPSICIVGKTHDEDVYFVKMNGFLPNPNKQEPLRFSIAKSPQYQSFELDEFVF